MATKTVKTDKYYKYLQEISNKCSQPSNATEMELLQECFDLIGNMNKNELDYIITTTIIVWKERCKTFLTQFLEEIFKKGGYQNSLHDGIPAVFRVVQTEDLELIDLFVKWGADFCSSWELADDKLCLTPLEYIVYYCSCNNQRLPKKVIKHLLNLGVSDNLDGLSGAYYYSYGEAKWIYKRAKSLVKIYRLHKAYRAEIAELKSKLSLTG